MFNSREQLRKNHISAVKKPRCCEEEKSLPLPQETGGSRAHTTNEHARSLTRRKRSHVTRPLQIPAPWTETLSLPLLFSAFSFRHTH